MAMWKYGPGSADLLVSLSYPLTPVAENDHLDQVPTI
jgi:hypothetical protein